jgi:hypothetical protein
MLRPGTVVCYGADGHVRVETAVESVACRGRGGVLNDVNDVVQMTAADADGCVDRAVPTDDKHFAQRTTVEVDSVFTVLALPLAIPNLISPPTEAVGCDFDQERPPARSATLISLSTIVLVV